MTKRLTPVLAALALLLAACGSGGQEETATLDSAESPQGDSLESSPDGSVESSAESSVEVAAQPAIDDGAVSRTLGATVLNATLDRSSGPASARFEGRIDVVGRPDSDLPGANSLIFAGAYDLANDASEMSMDFGDLLAAAAESDPDAAAEMAQFGAFFEEPLEMITIGDTTWIRWSLLSLLTGTEGQWLEGQSDETGRLADDFGFGASGSPTDILELLADADATIEQLGPEELRGVPTTHYRAVIDAATLAERMSPDERQELEGELGGLPIAEFPMEFWIDDAGLLHRYVLDLSDPALLDQAGDAPEAMTLTFDMWDHGLDLGIVPPPADQIVTEDEITFDLSDLGG